MDDGEFPLVFPGVEDGRLVMRTWIEKSFARWNQHENLPVHTAAGNPDFGCPQQVRRVPAG
jgi:hypothetical protein